MLSQSEQPALFLHPSQCKEHVMDVSAKVTSKGQVTIPKAVREALTLRTGDRVIFRVEQHRAIIARTPDLIEMAGSVEIPAAKRGATWDQVRSTAREHQARRSR